MDKLVVVNKPSDITSRDVVNKLCKIFNTKKTNMDDPEIKEITDNLKKLIIMILYN